MTEPFALFREAHILSDGTHVTVRALLPEDRPALEEALHRATPGTLRSRFLSESFRPNAEMLRYLTEVDGWDHVALVATVDSLDLKQELGVGIARFIRLTSAPNTAEAAVTVDAAMRRRGLAKLLLGALGKLALERGIEHFRAYVLEDNDAVQTALDAVEGVVRFREDDVWVYDIPIQPKRGDDGGEGTVDNANPFASALRFVALATDKVRVFLKTTRESVPLLRTRTPTAEPDGDEAKPEE
ncbi:MAG: GNAT family N-acetyltransferase [Polyangiaceae bacterium]